VGKFEGVYEIEEAHEIEEVVEIEVNHKIEEEVIWALGWDFSPLFRSRFLGPFLTSFWISQFS
jgi:hypothetical protein